MPFEVRFDMDQFRHHIGIDPTPKAPFPVKFNDVEKNERDLINGLSPMIRDVCKSPQGALRYPYLVPGSIYDQLWDWDAYFMGFGLLDHYPQYYQGAIQNFLERIGADGRPVKLMRPDGSVNDTDFPYPIQAQWCAAVVHNSGDIDWLRPWWDRLTSCRAWYETQSQRRRGLFRQPISRGAGVDNDPVIYGRRHETVAMIDINTFHYREYLALAYLASQLGHVADALNYQEKAERLREAINTYMWDPIDGMFYHLDLSDHVDVTRQEITWELPYKIRSGASLFALWSGVADTDKARRMIEEHVLNPDEYLSDYGVRSLARNERMYNNAAMGDPSNWQGPVWGLLNALTAYGLARYGYREEAIELASRLVALFAGDLRQNGSLHEYYHAETGAPVINPGFLSWNLMSIRLLQDLRTGYDPTVIPEY